jgi:hypothetical protein
MGMQRLGTQYMSHILSIFRVKAADMPTQGIDDTGPAEGVGQYSRVSLDAAWQPLIFAKSRFHQLTSFLANKRRTLVRKAC